MSRLEQNGKIRDRLFRKPMKSSRPIGSAMENGLSAQRTMSSLRKQLRKRLSMVSWQYWTKESRKTSRP